MNNLDKKLNLQLKAELRKTIIDEASAKFDASKPLWNTADAMIEFIKESKKRTEELRTLAKLGDLMAEIGMLND